MKVFEITLKNNTKNYIKANTIREALDMTLDEHVIEKIEETNLHERRYQHDAQVMDRRRGRLFRRKL